MPGVNEEILHRLDQINATLRLAFEPQLREARSALRSDAVVAGILEGSGEWIASSDLQKNVAKATGKSTRTVRDRLPELVSTGALMVRGSDARPEYRRTGLV